jgi:hypothetical protein
MGKYMNKCIVVGVLIEILMALGLAIFQAPLWAVCGFAIVGGMVAYSLMVVIILLIVPKKDW